MFTGLQLLIRLISSRVFCYYYIFPPTLLVSEAGVLRVILNLTYVSNLPL